MSTPQTFTESNFYKAKRLSARKAFFIFHAAAKDGKLYIGADSFENGTWKKDLIHEYTHFAEGSAEYAKLAKFLIDEDLTVDTKNGKQTLYSIAANAVLGKGYVSAEALSEILAKQEAGKPLTAEEAKAHALFCEELMAHATEHLLGNEAFIDKLVAKDAPLARKAFDKIVEVCKAIGGNAASKTLRTAQKLYIKAAEQSGNTRLAKYFLSHAPEIEEEESLDSESEVRYNRKKTAKYISYDKIGVPNVSHIRSELKKLYGDIENGVADGIAIAREDSVFIVDSGKENGEITFGIRKVTRIENDDLRAEYVRRTNDESVSKGYISDGLSSKLGSEYDHDRGRNLRRESGAELQSDQEQSQDNERRVSRKDADHRGVKFSLKDSTGTALTEEQAEYFKDSRVRDKDGNLLVVYHGSGENFNVFDITKSRSYDERPDYDLPGFYFSESDMESGGYGDKVKAYYVNITNPYEGDTYQLRKDKGTFRKVYDYLVSEGYDGIIDTEMGEGFTEIIAFHPEQIKLTTNKTPTRSSDIRFSFKSTKSGMANDALSPYDEELTRLIGERGDIIVDSREKLVEVVDLAFDDPNHKATAYFGIISPDTLEKIKNSVSNLPKELEDALFKAGKDYSIAATLDSIRHLVDDKNLDRADVVDYVDRLADTIVDADSVSFDFYTKGSNRTPGLLFKKVFSDGTIITFDLVSHKKRALSLQTLYMESADYQKKKRSAETLLMQNNAASKTSKTQVGQTFTNSIAQESDSVKRKKSTTQLSRKAPRPSGVTYEISDGQVKKLIANYTRGKTYSKKEADEAIHEILTNALYAEDERATLRGKSREEVVDMLWQGLNGVDPGKRASVALEVADYVIEHSMLERALDGNLESDADLVNLLKPYLRKLELDSLKDEIAHRYDDKARGVLGRWGKRSGERGLPVDVVAKELAEQGFVIEEQNPADVFFAIAEKQKRTRS